VALVERPARDCAQTKHTDQRRQRQHGRARLRFIIRALKVVARGSQGGPSKLEARRPNGRVCKNINLSQLFVCVCVCRRPGSSEEIAERLLAGWPPRRPTAAEVLGSPPGWRACATWGPTSERRRRRRSIPVIDLVAPVARRAPLKCIKLWKQIVSVPVRLFNHSNFRPAHCYGR
jgi:hypothetical protein